MLREVLPKSGLYRPVHTLHVWRLNVRRRSQNVSYPPTLEHFLERSTDKLFSSIRVQPQRSPFVAVVQNRFKRLCHLLRFLTPDRYGPGVFRKYVYDRQEVFVISVERSQLFQIGQIRLPIRVHPNRHYFVTAEILSYRFMKRVSLLSRKKFLHIFSPNVDVPFFSLTEQGQNSRITSRARNIVVQFF